MGQIDTTLGALVDAEPALRRVSEQDGLSQKTRYHVAKLAKLVGQETQHFREQREGLFKAHGKERPAATEQERRMGALVFDVPPDKTSELVAQIKDLCAVPISLAWAPLRSVDLTHAKASDLVDLGPLVELIEPE